MGRAPNCFTKAVVDAMMKIQLAKPGGGHRPNARPEAVGGWVGGWGGEVGWGGVLGGVGVLRKKSKKRKQNQHPRTPHNCFFSRFPPGFPSLRQARKRKSPGTLGRRPETARRRPAHHLRALQPHEPSGDHRRGAGRDESERASHCTGLPCLERSPGQKPRVFFGFWRLFIVWKTCFLEAALVNLV